VNRNTLFAFILMIATVLFFQSPWYYHNILKRPHPSEIKKTQQIENKKDTVVVSKKAVADTIQSDQVERELPDTKIEVAVDSLTEESGYDTIWIENEKVICGIAQKGAEIISLKTKEYFYRKNKRESGEDIPIELIPDTTVNPQFAQFAIDEEIYDNTIFNCDDSTITLKEDETKSVVFYTTTKSGTILKRIYTFSGESYKIEQTIESNNLSGKKVTIGWKRGITESEEKGSKKSVQYDVKKIHLYDGGETEHIAWKKDKKESKTGSFEWVALTSKYFMLAIIPQHLTNGDVSINGFQEQKEEKKFNYQYAYKKTADGPEEKFWIYAGPTKVSALKKMGYKLEKVFVGGWGWFLRADIWFPKLCMAMLWLLTAIVSVVKDYGLAIILITIIVKIITYPLSLSQMKSMSRMKEIQPRLTSIRQKYKSNPQKMNEEIMKLYRENGVNPINPGCLPMFLQMPILFSLFIVLRKAIEMRGASTFIIPWVNDLSQPEVLFRLPIDIPMYGNNFALVPIIMAAVTFIQNKMTIKDPNQKMMIYFMPIFMLVLFNGFPSGLVLYWTFSSVIGVFQQRMINNSVEKFNKQRQEQKKGKR